MEDKTTELLLLLAKAGDGYEPGYGWLGDDVPKLTGWTRGDVDDAIELLEGQGLVEVRNYIGRSPSVRLNLWGREAAHRAGAMVPSPVDDAESLRELLRNTGEGERRGRNSLSGTDLCKTLSWHIDRLDDAVTMLEDDGLVKTRRFMGPGRLHAELTAAGRAS